jgi:hypothetical protein
MNCLFELHRYNEAIELGREWLALWPYDVAAHSASGVAMAANGDLGSAAQHLGYVMLLRPELEQAHADLRRILLSFAKEPDGLAATARCRSRCTRFTTNAGRTGVVAFDVSRFEIARWN